MKLINRLERNKYVEIELEKSFMFWKWTVRYRMYDKAIFRYLYPETFIRLGLMEHLNIMDYFKIKD